MSQESLHYLQYLSGIITEEQFYEIEEQLNEGLARNLLGAGALALGSLFGGPSASAQTPPSNPPAMTAKADEFGVSGDETQYTDAKHFTKDLVSKLRLHKGGFEDTYGRGGAELGKIKIVKVDNAKTSPDGKSVIVTISGMGRGVKSALPQKVSNAVEELMGKAGSVRVYGIEGTGNYLGQVPDDIFSPGKTLHPFTAQIEIRN